MTEIAEQRLLICAPYGKDAELAAAALRSAGLEVCVCGGIAALASELGMGAAGVLVAEEVLLPGALDALSRYIAHQPGWSDLPVIVLTKTGVNSPWIQDASERLGNVSLLERPVRAATLISVARSMLRTRRRQYDVRHADQRKDEFLAMLGHELRNPLAPIGAAAQLLGMVAYDPEKVRRSSEIIARQVVHMTSLIDDLLDMARVTRGLITLERKPVDMRQVLSEAVEQVTPLIRLRRHHMALHLPPEPAVVQGDRKRLVQVVANILNNASKYTPECGIITSRLLVTDSEVVVDITDNGIGMTEEVAARVFDLFAQAERSSDRSQGGLGLGLSIVRSLVESHGGDVSASSAGLGGGSTFTIRLQRMRHDPVTSGRDDGVPSAIACAGSALDVLVVDDNEDAANTMGMLLEAAGYRVTVRYTAAGGLEQAAISSPRICLLDIGLPDMEGILLAQRLRQLPETAQAILIAVTGYGQAQDKANARAAGFDHHFVKPVDSARLLALLQRLSCLGPGTGPTLDSLPA